MGGSAARKRIFDLGPAQEHEMGTEQSFRPAAGDNAGNHHLVASENAKGAPVYAADGNRLGRIEWVMADAATGEIAYAVVNFGLGNSIGFEIDHHRVPWSLLVYNPRFDGYELRIADGRASRHDRS
jgi:PRC-barrel domain